MKNKNIVPITFIAGTGGRFISYLINSAKAIESTPLKLSKYGNAHAIWDLEIEIASTPFNNLTSSAENAKFFFSSFAMARKKVNYTKNNPLPYYGSCHTDDVEGLLWYFDKVINISFDVEDIHNIALVFAGKAYVDDANINDTAVLKQLYSNTITLLINSVRRPKPELEPNLLNISWKDIYQNDPTKLIHKLSEFCNIPHEKFRIDELIEWRNRTSNCIKEMSSILDNNDRVSSLVPIISIDDKVGKFVEYFIVNAAEFNGKLNVLLNEHCEVLNHRLELDVPQDDIDSFVKITQLINEIPNQSSTIFYSCFIKDYELVKSYFKKSILITDDNESTDNMLCISSKELIQDDITTVVEKISNFTNIDASQFSINDLIKWRNRMKEIQALANVAK